jgi:predicted RNA-binding Zn-ribbon protein involved in translation (DUF1610 family)
MMIIQKTTAKLRLESEEYCQECEWVGKVKFVLWICPNCGSEQTACNACYNDDRPCHICIDASEFREEEK